MTGNTHPQAQDLPNPAPDRSWPFRLRNPLTLPQWVRLLHLAVLAEFVDFLLSFAGVPTSSSIFSISGPYGKFSSGTLFFTSPSPEAATQCFTSHEFWSRPGTRCPGSLVTVLKRAGGQCVFTV